MSCTLPLEERKRPAGGVEPSCASAPLLAGALLDLIQSAVSKSDSLKEFSVWRGLYKVDGDPREGVQIRLPYLVIDTVPPREEDDVQAYEGYDQANDRLDLVYSRGVKGGAPKNYLHLVVGDTVPAGKEKEDDVQALFFHALSRLLHFSAVVNIRVTTGQPITKQWVNFIK